MPKFLTNISTDTAAGDNILFRAYDVDGLTWKTFATLTANNTPTFALDGDVTGVTQSQSDNSTKLATTAYVDTGLGNKANNPATGVANEDEPILFLEGTTSIRYDSGGVFTFNPSTNLFKAGNTTLSGNLLIDTGATPTDNQVLVQANALGGVGMTALGADDVWLAFDAEYDASTWKSLDAGSNVRVGKSGDYLKWEYDNGVTVGSAITWETGLQMQLSGIYAGYVGINGAPGVNPLKVTGNIEVTNGIAFFDGTATRNMVIDHGSPAEDALVISELDGARGQLFKFNKTGTFEILTTPGDGTTDDVLTWNATTKEIGKVSQASISGVTGSGTDNRLAVWNGTDAIDSEYNFTVDATGIRLLASANSHLILDRAATTNDATILFHTASSPKWSLGTGISGNHSDFELFDGGNTIYSFKISGSNSVVTLSSSHTSNIGNADDVITKGYADSNYAGGGSPGGTGTELQYRVDGSTFGAVPNTAYSFETNYYRVDHYQSSFLYNTNAVEPVTYSSVNAYYDYNGGTPQWLTNEIGWSSRVIQGENYWRLEGSTGSVGAGAQVTWDTNSIIYADLENEEVGINTNTPDSPLTILKTNSTAITNGGEGQLRIYNQSASDGSSGIFLGNSSNRKAAIVGIKKSSSNDHDLAFYTNGAAADATEKMRILSTGNVGIGTNGPGNKLHVYNNAAGDIARFEGSTGALYIENSSSYAGLYSWYGSSQDLILQRPGGDVGIGTTTPDAKLDIEETSATNKVVSRIFNLSAGDNTSAIFSIGAGGGAYTQLRQNTGSGTQTIGGAYDTILINNWTTNDNGDLIFGTNAVERMRVAHNGNVGIGATVPDRKLHVNSTGTNIVAQFESTDAYAILELRDNTTTNTDAGNEVLRRLGDVTSIHSGGNQAITIDASGNVGIGATSPAPFKLDVTGDVRANDSLTITGVATGETFLKADDGATNIFTIARTSNQGSNTVTFDSFSGSPFEFDASVYMTGADSTAWFNGTPASPLLLGNDTTNTISDPQMVAETGESGILQYQNSYITGNATFTTIPSATNSIPFGEVFYCTNYSSFNTEFIPVTPGEEIYGEVYVMVPTGQTNIGKLYMGISRYDKDKNAIATNNGNVYFVASAITPTANSTWVKYSGYWTIDTSHTPYLGSDGGGVRYIKVVHLMNYNTGTAQFYTTVPLVKRVNQLHRHSPHVSFGTPTVAGAWSSSYNAIELGSKLSLWSITAENTSGLSGIGYNTYYDGSTYRFKNPTSADQACAITLQDGVITFRVESTSSTQATAITWANAMTIANTGSISCSSTVTATNFIDSSDIRKKKYVRALKAKDLANFNDIEINSYVLRKSDGRRQYGVIANNMQKLFPNLVTTEDDGMLAFDYRSLSMLHLAKTQEQEKKIEELTNKVDELTKLVNKLINKR